VGIVTSEDETLHAYLHKGEEAPHA
jgi:hypothetical protein